MYNCPCPLVVYEWHPSVYILTGGKNSGDATLGKIEKRILVGGKHLGKAPLRRLHMKDTSNIYIFVCSWN